MTLQFNRNSWHARINWFTFRYVPYGRISLCPYFWLTVVSCIFAPFVAIARPVHRWLENRPAKPPMDQNVKEKIGLGIIIGLLLFWAGVGVYVGLTHVGLWTTLLFIGITAGSMAGILGLILGLVFFYNWYEEHHVTFMRTPRPYKERSPPVKVYRPREPSLLWAWLKGKKEKVCPYIEWEP